MVALRTSVGLGLVLKSGGDDDGDTEETLVAFAQRISLSPLFLRSDTTVHTRVLSPLGAETDRLLFNGPEPAVFDFVVVVVV